MSGYEAFLAANDRFLAEALTWLRERLESAAEPTTPAPQPAAGRAEPRAIFGRRTAPHRATPPPGQEPLQVSAGAAAAPDGDLDEPPLLVELAHRAGLTAFERNVVLLAASMELDTRIPALCARAHRAPTMSYPTFALAMTIFDDPSWDALSPEGPLRFWRLIDAARVGAEPLTSARLRADDRVVNFIKGLHHLDERLAAVVHALPGAGTGRLADSQRAVADHLAARLTRLRGESAPPPPVLLLGADRDGKRLVAAEVARSSELRLFELTADDLPTDPSELATLARLWHRETLLAPVSLHIDAHDVDRSGPTAAALRRWLREAPGLVFVDVREPWQDLADGALAADVGRPTKAEQLAAWREALPGDDGDVARRLTGQFDLDLTTIGRIGEGAGGDQPSDPWAACLVHTRPGLDELARRLRPLAGWDDLQLPADEMTQLRRIADQVAHRGDVYDTMGFRARMNRGLGISVLFAGESGTGKTTAAEVLARDLDLLLYRIDLSAVVDKYIGETEKNLRRLFDAAEGGGAILFFDEADALFGRRSEVRDSHDRYANIEINYLLQRLESYEGLAILATNRRSALDLAFVRRLRFIVTFPFPGLAQRTAMWQRALPSAVPVEGIDAARLARLDLTGGSIQAIALNAAFLAAAAGSPVTMPLLLDAARAELRKLDKPVNEADFRWPEPAGRQS